MKPLKVSIKTLHISYSANSSLKLKTSSHPLMHQGLQHSLLTPHWWS